MPSASSTSDRESCGRPDCKGVALCPENGDAVSHDMGQRSSSRRGGPAEHDARRGTICGDRGGVETRAPEEGGGRPKGREPDLYFNVIGEWRKQEVCLWEGDSLCPVFYFFVRRGLRQVGRARHVVFLPIFVWFTVAQY